MNHVLLLYESVEPSNQESYCTLKDIADRGQFRLKQVEAGKITAQILDWSDVIYGVRCTSSIECQLAGYASKLGKFWITAIDDDFLSLGDDYGKDGQGYWNGKKRSLIKVLRKTDCLVGVNRYIEKKYTKIGNIPRCCHTDTAVDVSNVADPGRNQGKVKIVCYVNDGTLEMFERYIRPLLPWLSSEYGNRIVLYFVALRPDMSEYKGKIEYHYVPHMGFEAFKKYMATEAFDIGLAPLVNTGFAKYKYFNKYIEYTRAGIAGIYSDCRIYRQVVTDGYNGMLCSDSIDSWKCAIQLLADHKERRIKIVQNAQEYIRQNLSKEHVQARLLKDIPELGEYHAPKKKANSIVIAGMKLRYLFFRVTCWIHTVYCCIKNRNLQGLIRRFYQKVLKKPGIAG